MIETIIDQYKNRKIALYGIGTETERFIEERGKELLIVGILDGFRTDGEIYGYPIIPISEIPSRDVSLIIVVARPGSCKAIAKRIGEFCRACGIALFDVRGRDLLINTSVSYEFKSLNGNTKQRLLDMTSNADVVSFDLFDTLITRKVYAYTDVFELVDLRLREKGICIPDFAKLRLYAEKELSKDNAPRLEDIYKFVLKSIGGSFITASELAVMEWEIDLSVMRARDAVCNIFRRFTSEGKQIVITTDTYYSDAQIGRILKCFNITGANRILVSSEHGTSKTQRLYETLTREYPLKKILHIGDDELADMEKAAQYGIETYRVYSGMDLFSALGGLGIEDDLNTLSDRVKAGMFIADMFNTPFWFEDEERKLAVDSAFRIGYLFCAPMITDFLLWMKKKAETEGYMQMLFCARDGYLPERLFKEISSYTNPIYFLSSRTAVIRAGMENERDIKYVDSMKYFGTPEGFLKARFGIIVDDINSINREKEILRKAGIQREYYKKYIEKLDIQDLPIAMFDFVAKGTTQMYLQKLFSNPLKGFYFLQLESEFMADKGLDIESFYSEQEKDDSAIFDNYYILETILTSPYPQLEEFDANGNPVFAEETRTDQDIRCFEQAQRGITAYFEEYLAILPDAARIENKKLDEKLLSLINKIMIKAEDFLALTVEDPFFGRMTDIKDVIG